MDARHDLGQASARHAPAFVNANGVQPSQGLSIGDRKGDQALMGNSEMRTGCDHFHEITDETEA
jgi:hypothetical protein